MMSRLFIVGIGYKPLNATARVALASADYVLGSRRLVDVFAGYDEYGESSGKVKLIESVDETMRFIHDCFEQEVGNIVLLGSGDPLFFGIGARSIREFGPDAVEIIPDLTSLQWAFSRAKIPWDDALFISFHAGPDPNKRRRLKYDLEDLPSLLDAYDTIGILTDRENDPAAIARFLVSSRADHPSLLLVVGERMGYGDERITQGRPDEVAAGSFVHPNVVIVRKPGQGSGPFETGKEGPRSPETPSSMPRFGLREDEIAHGAGLITKDEVRAVSLHALRLPDEGTLWDIGAGSGSISVEAARLCPQLRIFAVERSEEQVSMITRNREKFLLDHLTIVPGRAPAALSALPHPDRVFIGGSGGSLTEIVQTVSARMTGGYVVINATTLETLNEAVNILEKTSFSVRVSEVSVARSKSVGDKRYMAALNPIFIIVGEKE